MFVALLVLLLVAAAVHTAASGRRSRQAVAQLFLLYVLVGYCGVAMIGVAAFGLASPDRFAAWLGWPAGNPFQQFGSFALLGMGVASILSLWLRGPYLVGPAVAWAVFFAGATVGHLADLGQRGVSHGTALHVFATHTAITLLLVALLALGGAASSGHGDSATPSDAAAPVQH